MRKDYVAGRPWLETKPLETKSQRREEELHHRYFRNSWKQARLAAEHKAKQAAAAQRKRERRLVRDREKAAKAKAADATTQATAQRQREENERKARSRKNIEQIE
ncbi:predicted protein [Plenodomus lingam JN3]|uniref:Uncharacterized protein n=1 Tax=Leptosphaeria maculans (strain JN3 / isolate v23.1.3 / race Av1-4-5-6-7-8) TaxID=985895 RepID=M1Z7S2_LEPMJ|nr:predicted protein [Plenodomus lingam JN3]